MQTVEMKYVDALRFELGKRLVEIRPEQTRERLVVCAIMFGDLGKRGFVVTARVLIAVPGIDAETARAGLVLRDGRRARRTAPVAAPRRGHTQSGGGSSTPPRRKGAVRRNARANRGQSFL